MSRKTFPSPTVVCCRSRSKNAPLDFFPFPSDLVVLAVYNIC